MVDEKRLGEDYVKPNKPPQKETSKELTEKIRQEGKFGIPGYDINEDGEPEEKTVEEQIKELWPDG